MRRLISLVSALVALVALGLVLYNATVVDRRAPEVTRISLSAPAGDDRLAQTLTAIDLEFSEAVRTNTVESRFRIEPYVAGAFSWDGTTLIFTPSAKLPTDTEFTITLAAGWEDVVGNVAGDAMEPWVFRTVGPPVIVRAIPADGSTGVPIDGAAVDLEFDRLMDTASVEAAITVDPPVEMRASWSGETVRLAFEVQLRFGTTYTLTVGRGAADTGGLRLVAPYSLTFSTVAAGLSILETIPTESASGVGVRTPIAVRFDAPIDADAARAAFRITPSVGGDIRIITLPSDAAPAGTPANPELADAIVFVPDDPLATHTTYTVTLDGTVTRADDPEAVAAGRTWSFTTGSPSVTGQNQIAFLSDRSGVRNVWLMNPDGTNPRQVTTDLAPVSGFDATGDGARIAFSAAGVVRVVEVDGEVGEVVTPDDAFDYAPVFTPDDASLIVGRRGAAGEDLGYWLVPLDGVGGEPRQVLDHGAPPIGSSALGGEGIEEGDGTPAWMSRVTIDPTGAKALLVTAEDEPYVVDLGDEDTPPQRVELHATTAPAWSPRHGAFVLVAAGPDPRPTVWTVDVDGEIDEIERDAPAMGPIAIGVDGTVAVVLRTGSSVAIELLRPGSSEFEPIAGADEPDYRWPSFAADARSLVAGRVVDSRPTASAGIWSIDLATGVATQLTTDGAYARWLP